jgi:hypothetical protein
MVEWWLAGEKPETCYSATPSATNLIWSHPGLNPRPSGEKPPCNHLRPLLCRILVRKISWHFPSSVHSTELLSFGTRCKLSSNYIQDLRFSQWWCWRVLSSGNGLHGVISQKIIFFELYPVYLLMLITVHFVITWTRFGHTRPSSGSVPY